MTPDNIRDAKSHCGITYQCIVRKTCSFSEINPKKQCSTDKTEKCSKLSLNNSDLNWECERVPSLNPLGLHHHPLKDKNLNPDMEKQNHLNENYPCTKIRKDVLCNKDSFKGCSFYHINGMLDRDQRSVVNKIRDGFDCNNSVVRHGCCCCGWTLDSSGKFPRERRFRNNKHRWNSRITQSK